MKSILIVEDTPTDQRMMTGFLTQAGFGVTTATSVDEAWQWLQTHPSPDLIILDIVMPDKSGLELCRMVQTDAQLKSIPIIFCSCKGEEFDRFWALRQGGKAYIVKPFAPKEFLDTVYQHVH
ncbi:MAG: response regulator [Leptolyngbyaceae cyanobacterium bins.59]|nr:response regulator [Leptolyngbyaceae cyanobacterium bins.59]